MLIRPRPKQVVKLLKEKNMKITQQYFGLGIEKPLEITIDQARVAFRSANTVKRAFDKSFIVSHGIKGRPQVRSVITIAE